MTSYNKSKICVFCDGSDAPHQGLNFKGRWMCIHCWHQIIDLLNGVGKDTA